MEGLLINRITSLSFDEQRLIHESYPQANLSEILIFEEGRKPSRPIEIFLLFGGGTLAIGLALAAMWIARTEGESVVGETSGGWPDPFHFSAVALLGAGLFYAIAGMSVVWILLALWSRSVGLIVAALVFSVPMNFAFVRQFRGTIHAKPGGTSLGLGRIAWLLIMTSTYLLGIATAIEFARLQG